MQRHFAFFRQDTGVYVREWRGPVPEPDLAPALIGDARKAALNDWATTVSQPKPGEVGLDVTRIGWPAGDFCYCTFDTIDRRLEWGPPRHFIQIDRETLCVRVNSESHRPIRSTDDKFVMDITGTALEPFHGHIFGRIVRREDGWALEPLRDPELVPVHTQLALEAARIDLPLMTEPIRTLAHV